MKLILLAGVLCLVAGAQAGLFEDALALLSKEEREFAEKIRDYFKSLANNENQGQEGALTRGIMKEIKQHCDCDKSSCGCCGKVDAMGTKMNACGNVTVISDEAALQVKAKVGFMTLIDEKVSLNTLDRACKKMPLFSKIKLCIKSKLDQLEKSGDFKYCMALELEAFGTLLSYMNFKCMNFIDGKLTTIDEMMAVDPNLDPVIAVDSPNPIQAIVDAIKDAKKNADSGKE